MPRNAVMRRTFRYDAQLGRMIEVAEAGVRLAPDVMPDLPAYRSPVDGRLVDGRAQRREDLKRHGCRPYETSEKTEFVRRREADDAALTRSVDRTVEKFWYEQNSRGRELLEQAVRAGVGVEYARRG
jgi:hypothetical protein